MGPIILANIGDMYVQQGNNEEGASYLEKAARKAASSDSKNFLGPIYFIKAAKVFMEMGKDDKAIALLQQATEDYDNRTQEFQEATKLLAMLKSRNS
jgi:FimV-like protein